MTTDGAVDEDQRADDADGRSARWADRLRTRRGVAALAAAVVLLVLASGVVLYGQLKSPEHQCAVARNEVAAQQALNASRRPGPTIAFLGDSYTAGRGALSVESGYATRTANRLGLSPFLAGFSGTGFVGSAPCVDATFATRVDEVIAARPDVVVVQGGINDRAATPAQLRAAQTELFARLRAGAPSARLVMVGPSDPFGGADPRLSATSKTLRVNAESARVPYLDPVAERWLGPEDIGWDHLHPNDDGHALMSWRLTEALFALGYY